MQFTYDATHNIAYLRFAEAAGDVETVRVSEDVLIDLNPDGSVCGIELLDAGKQLAGVGGASLLVEAGGRTVTLPLVAAE
ncbi:DUF2283 domain-containing protein [Bosea sp. R86505]|uniref:DUF2283 domain-containing protein n=1 Tax=Bosea sp. R86505 TaxID=3101710 RepID=UPI00366B0599